MVRLTCRHIGLGLTGTILVDLNSARIVEVLELNTVISVVSMPVCMVRNVSIAEH